MATFLYRRGNGNEGDYPRAVVTLADDQCPYAALPALVANDYIAGKRVRRHIMRTIETEGDANYSINAWVHEGPEEETEFGAAYITATLEHLSDSDIRHYDAQGMTTYATLRDALDNAAWKYFRKLNAAKA